MKNIIIIGASGFGREVAWLVERINKVKPTWNILGFLDDDETIQDKTVNGYKVLGNISDGVSQYDQSHFICAIGSSKIRQRVVEKIYKINPDIKFCTLVDPSVEMSEHVSIKEGTIICAHTIVTVNISIGKHVIVNLDCTIGHDAIIGDFSTLYPSVNLSGITDLGQCVELGTGSRVIQGIEIGNNTIVGAGSTVIKNLPSNCTAVGSPAKPIKY